LTDHSAHGFPYSAFTMQRQRPFWECLHCTREARRSLLAQDSGVAGLATERRSVSSSTADSQTATYCVDAVRIKGIRAVKTAAWRLSCRQLKGEGGCHRVQKSKADMPVGPRVDITMFRSRWRPWRAERRAWRRRRG
jgi:hypothetical protein